MEQEEGYKQELKYLGELVIGLGPHSYDVMQAGQRPLSGYCKQTPTATFQILIIITP